MNIVQAIALGLVQGLTEFIPVSSSGHLLLAQQAMGIGETGLAFDVALHIGTLAALVVYFNRDIRELVAAIFKRSEKTRLAWLLALATVPAVVAGALIQDAAETKFRSPVLVCITLAFMAVVMLVAEKWAARRKGLKDLTKVSPKQSLLVGSAQALALVPGVSRSGSTITAGLFLGLDRVAATRFSFLLSIPVTFGAILKVMLDSSTSGLISDEKGLFIAGILTAFISGVFAIKFLLKFLSKHTLQTFAYYRIGLAAVALLLIVIF